MNFDVSKLPKVLHDRVTNIMLEHMRIAADYAASPIYVRLTEAEKELVDHIRKERDAILDLTVGVKEPVEVKVTPCDYCAKCRKDFEPKQFVHYMVHDNDCVCIPCSLTIDTEKEPRVYVPDHEEDDE